MSDKLYEAGMHTRRMVLGDAYVDRAEANKTEFDNEFQEYITKNVWGTVWTRPGLTLRERSLVVIALLTALGQDEELALHIHATQNTGASVDDIKEVLLQSAVYAGVPAANHAFKIAKKILADLSVSSSDDASKP